MSLADVAIEQTAFDNSHASGIESGKRAAPTRVSSSVNKERASSPVNLSADVENGDDEAQTEKMTY